MASLEQNAFLPMKVLAEASATNAPATATAAASTTNQKYNVNMVALSMSAAPSAATQATLTINSLVFTINIPATLIAPLIIPMPRPIQSATNGTVVFSCPALGASVVCTVTIFGSVVTGG